MKSLIKSSVLFLLLGLSISANADIDATDLTPFFQGLKEGCSLENSSDDFPKLYRKAIISQKTTGSKKVTSDNSHSKTVYQLKNASIFGYPVRAVAFSGGLDGIDISLFFLDAKFMVLRPQFKIPADKGYKITKDNSKGYIYTDDSNEGELVFDKKDKSITCSVSNN